MYFLYCTGVILSYIIQVAGVGIKHNTELLVRELQQQHFRGSSRCSCSDLHRPAVLFNRKESVCNTPSPASPESHLAILGTTVVKDSGCSCPQRGQ